MSFKNFINAPVVRMQGVFTPITEEAAWPAWATHALVRLSPKERVTTVDGKDPAKDVRYLEERVLGHHFFAAFGSMLDFCDSEELMDGMDRAEAWQKRGDQQPVKMDGLSPGK